MGRASRWSLLALALFLACVDVGGSQARAELSEDPAISKPALGQVPREVLVRFKTSTSEAQRQALGEPIGRRDRKTLLADLELWHLDRDVSVGEAIRRLEASDLVKRAMPNGLASVDAVQPNDPLFPKMWNLTNGGQASNGVSGTNDADIDAPEAWSVTTGNNSVTVAVIDTGIALDHPDLSPNLWQSSGETGLDAQRRDKRSNGVDDDGNGFVDDWRGWDFLEHDNDPSDRWMVGNNYKLLTHGTHVAGTIGARGNNGIGVTGVSWNVKLLPVAVCNPSCALADIIDGFVYAGRQGAQVANASLGGGNWSEDERAELRNAVNSAPNTLFVTSAGNGPGDNDVEEYLPCTLDAPNVVCVTATDSHDQLAEAHHGRRTVDIGAPGTSIFSTQLGMQSIYSEGFESEQSPPIGNGWQLQPANGAWARSNSFAAGGRFSLTDSPDSSVPTDGNSEAQHVAPVDVTGQRACALRYKLRADLGGSASLFVQASRDSSWMYGQHSNFESVQHSGFSEHWMLGDFPPLEVPTEMYFRFIVNGGPNPSGDGVYIDDVNVACQTGAYDADDYQPLSGTSMASPHVAGAAALLKAKYATADPSIMKSALLAGSDSKPSLAGRTVSGGRLNVAKALERMKQTYVDVVNGDLTVADASNRANRITVEKSGQAFTVTESGGALYPGAGCWRPVSGDSKKVSCSGVSRVIVNSGPANDTVELKNGVSVPGVLSGGSGNDSLKGSDGDDVLEGGAGSDSLVGRNGQDTADYSARTQPVIVNPALPGGDGSAGENDYVSSDVERVVGGSGADQLTGTESANLLIGNEGADTLIGNGGADWLFGGPGNDGIVGGTGVDLAAGGSGNDLIADGIFGSPESGGDAILGEGGDDVIASGIDGDTVVAGPGLDTVYAGAGPDTVDGLDGSGGDQLDCGSEVDRYRRDAGETPDTLVSCEAPY